MTKLGIDLDQFRSVERPIPSRKRGKRPENFSPVLITLAKRLRKTGGQTVLLAVVLSYLNWKTRGAPIKLTNKLLDDYGIDRYAKRRALLELECRGLVRVKRRAYRAPIVSLTLEGE
jgi:hypothetical protein